MGRPHRSNTGPSAALWRLALHGQARHRDSAHPRRRQPAGPPVRRLPATGRGAGAGRRCEGRAACAQSAPGAGAAWRRSSRCGWRPAAARAAPPQSRSRHRRSSPRRSRAARAGGACTPPPARRRPRTPAPGVSTQLRTAGVVRGRPQHPGSERGPCCRRPTPQDASRADVGIPELAAGGKRPGGAWQRCWDRVQEHQSRAQVRSCWETNEHQVQRISTSGSAPGAAQALGAQQRLPVSQHGMQVRGKALVGRACCCRPACSVRDCAGEGKSGSGWAPLAPHAPCPSSLARSRQPLPARACKCGEGPSAATPLIILLQAVDLPATTPTNAPLPDLLCWRGPAGRLWSLDSKQNPGPDWRCSQGTVPRTDLARRHASCVSSASPYTARPAD
jgi:hypothetical protein